MVLDDADVRPRSLLDRGAIDATRVGVGALVSLAAHVLPPLAYASYLAILALMVAVGVVSVDEPPPEPPPLEHVIQAHFIQRGELPDPRRLPDRQVPILRTDTPEPRHAPSKLDNPPPPRERDPHERQARSVEDDLQRLSEDAQVFAERAEAREREGDPDGIEGGERTASEGDLYLGRLAVFFRRGFTIPTTISSDEAQDLVAYALVDVGDDLRITGFRIQRSSGNGDFDQSVIEQLTRLQARGEPIPPPPEEVAAQYIGRTIPPVRFRGRDAR